MPEIPGILRLVYERGYEAVVVTNQRGVARGLMTLETLNTIHSNLQNLLKEKYGLGLLDIFCCVHDKDECECRKPKPGMLLEAARRHDIDLKVSWMVGDNEKDVEAGRRAGCKTILIAQDGSKSLADYVVTDMKSLESLLERVLEVNAATNAGSMTVKGNQ